MTFLFRKYAKDFPFQGGVCASFLFFLTSCLSSSPEWTTQSTANSSSPYHSTRLLFSPHDFRSEVEVEFLQGSYGTFCYLNTSFLPFLPDPCNPLISCVVLQIANQEKEKVIGERLEGGQRILLPTEVGCRILDALKNKEQVELTIGRYHVEIRPYTHHS